MKIVLVEPEKEARITEIKGELHEMQEIVGGLIQVLYPWMDDWVALICNDEGKIMGLPLNRVLKDYDVIAGTFFVCGLSEDNFGSLTDQQAQKYRTMFQYPEKFLQTPDGLFCIRYDPKEVKRETRKPSDYER